MCGGHDGEGSHFQEPNYNKSLLELPGRVEGEEEGEDEPAKKIERIKDA